MCGIVGCVGREDAVAILIDGLQKLEYRGYDSAGICMADAGVLTCAKKQGRIMELEKHLASNPVAGRVGIAHTRWATHGEPNEINAHPHLDCAGSIAVVHNGIIENHHALRTLLIEEGHVFISDTDSEVVSHLVEKFYDGDIEQAVIRAVECLEGTFGLAVLHQDSQCIVAARRGSPLIIGVDVDRTLLTSDAASIVGYTKKVVYLQDNDIAVLTADGHKIRSLDGGSVAREVEEILWSIDRIEKAGYKHFMLKEIYEQPQSVANTLRGRVAGKGIKLSVDIDVQSLRRILITACGTSWHSGLIGKHLIERLTGIPVEVDYASEFRYRDPVVIDGDLVIAISQSGETADTLAALREARKRGARTLGIVNVVGSSITREVDSGIYLHAGPEIGVASTKAFTCQITALLLLALHIRQEQGRQCDDRLLDSMSALPDLITKALSQAENIRSISREYKESANFLYLGRGFNFPVALEGALKLKEISYIHAEGYPAAEMKHGPIALIDADMPVVFVATHGAVFEKVVSNMQEVKARQGRIITVTDALDNTLEQLSEHVILVPQTNEELQPVVNVIPLQLLAYHIADMKNLNVDKPRNLAKSVTVE